MSIQTALGVLMLGLGLTLASCDKKEETLPARDGTTRTVNDLPASNTPTTTTTTTTSPTTQTTTTPADNTANNRPSTEAGAKTPLDQSQSSADVKITADIRRAIMDDSAMSFNAQNCKIITDRGLVTLRGVVNSVAERQSIEAKAKAVAGVQRVDNQLEVKTN